MTKAIIPVVNRKDVDSVAQFIIACAVYCLDLENTLVSGLKNITQKIITELNLQSCEDARQAFFQAGIIPSEAVNPQSVVNALNKAIKSGKRKEDDDSLFSFTYVEDRKKKEGTVAPSHIIMLNRVCAVFIAREKAIEKKRDIADKNLGRVCELYIQGKAGLDDIHTALDECEKTGLVGSENITKAKDLIVNAERQKTIIRKTGKVSLSFMDLSFIATGQEATANRNLVLCIDRQRTKAVQPTKGIYRTLRKERNFAFYDKIIKATKKQSAFQRIEYLEKALFDIAQEAQKANTKATKKDLQVIIAEIRTILNKTK